MDELPIKSRAEVASPPAPPHGPGGPGGPGVRRRSHRATPPRRPAAGTQAAAAARPRRRPGGGAPPRRPGRGGRQADHSSPTSDPLSAWRAGKVRAGRIGGLRAAQEDEASMTGDEWSAHAALKDAGPGTAARCQDLAAPVQDLTNGPHRDPMQDLATRDLAARRRTWRRATLTIGPRVSQTPGTTLDRHGIAGLDVEPRSGRSKTIDDAAIIAATMEKMTERLGVTHWSTRLLARHLGVRDATIARALRRYTCSCGGGRRSSSAPTGRRGKGKRCSRAVLLEDGEGYRAVHRREEPDPGARPEGDDAEAAERDCGSGKRATTSATARPRCARPARSPLAR